MINVQNLWWIVPLCWEFGLLIFAQKRSNRYLEKLYNTKEDQWGFREREGSSQ